MSSLSASVRDPPAQAAARLLPHVLPRCSWESRRLHQRARGRDTGGPGAAFATPGRTRGRGRMFTDAGVWRYLRRSRGKKIPAHRAGRGLWLDRWRRDFPPGSEARGRRSQIEPTSETSGTRVQAVRLRAARDGLLTHGKSWWSACSPRCGGQREIYRQAREYSVQRAFTRWPPSWRRSDASLSIILLALVRAWRRRGSFPQPGAPPQRAAPRMAVVGAATWITRSSRAPRMRSRPGARLRAHDRAAPPIPRAAGASEKLASSADGAGVAHGLRNPWRVCALPRNSPSTASRAPLLANR